MRGNEILAAQSGGVAIVGMSGRFPGAGCLEDFWKNLRDGVESISVVSDEELDAAGVAARRRLDARYVRAAAVLEGVDLFDAAFFNMPARDAQITDPQHRLFLECAWHALENAGCDPQRFPGEIGVFAGAAVFCEHGSLFGTAESCLHTVEKVAAIGVDGIACLIDFGTDYDTTMASLQHLAGLADLLKDARFLRPDRAPSLA